MNAQSKITRPWNSHSGVFKCTQCDGKGEGYRQDLSGKEHWESPCFSCEGHGHNPCAVCGFDVQIDHFDCFACETVDNLYDADARKVDPTKLAEAITKALEARLNAQVAA